MYSFRTDDADFIGGQLFIIFAARSNGDQVPVAVIDAQVAAGTGGQPVGYQAAAIIADAQEI